MTEGFVGRRTEVLRLVDGLKKAANSSGSLWLVTGPVGIGKTTLLKEAARQASLMGFKVLWGDATRSGSSSFHLFEDAFKSVEPTDGHSKQSDDGKSSLVILEERKGKKNWEEVTRIIEGKPTLAITREIASVVKERLSGSSSRIEFAQFSRTGVGETLSPTSLDTVGERVEEFLGRSPGGAVFLPHLEYLVVQNNFLSVLRLVQLLRELAEGSGGIVILSFNPEGMEPKERALLESEGDSAPGRSQETHHPARGRSGVVPRTLKFLGYLDQIEALSKENPLLLVLDDLGLADPASSDLLTFLAKNTRHLPVMILGATRTAEWGIEAGANPVLNRALDMLSREGLLSRVTLGPLGPKEVEELAVIQLGDKGRSKPADELDLTKALESIGGNPLLVTMHIRSLAREGSLSRSGKGGAGKSRVKKGQELEEPSLHVHRSLRRFLLSVIVELPETELQVLQMAAVSGWTFRTSAVAGALKEGEKETQKLLEQLADYTGFITQLEEKGVWSFTHRYFREIVLDELSVEKLGQLAERLADWMRMAEPDDPLEIARLYHESRDHSKGLTWFLKGAERALKDGDAESVVRCATWALDKVDPKQRGREEVLQQLLRFSQHLASHGAPWEAEVILLDLLRADLPIQDAIIAKRILVDVEVELGKLPEARDLLQKTLRSMGISPSNIDGELLATMDILSAEFDMRSGDHEAAYATAVSALERLGEKGDPVWKVRALDQIGWSFLRESNLTDAEKAFTDGRSLALSSKLHSYLPYHCHGLGRVELIKGDLPGALGFFLDAAKADIAEGNVIAASSELLFAAETLFLSGNLLDAEKVVMQSLQYSERFDSLSNAGKAFLLLGRIKMERGEWEAARSNFSLALNRFTLSGEGAMLDAGRLWLAAVSGEMGDPKGAIKQIASLPSGGPVYHQVMARLKELTGDLNGALSEIDRAHEEASQLGPVDRERIRLDKERLEHSLESR